MGNIFWLLLAQLLRNHLPQWLLWIEDKKGFLAKGKEFFYNSKILKRGKLYG